MAPCSHRNIDSVASKQKQYQSNCFAYIHDIGETENFTYYVSELLGPSLDLMVNRQEDDSASQSINFISIQNFFEKLFQFNFN